MAAGNPRRIAVAAVADRLGECDAVRAAVAFYHDSGQSDHARAVVAARIEPLAHASQNRAGLANPESLLIASRENSVRSCSTMSLARPSIALSAHVAGEAVRDHDVDAPSKMLLPSTNPW